MVNRVASDATSSDSSMPSLLGRAEDSSVDDDNDDIPPLQRPQDRNDDSLISDSMRPMGAGRRGNLSNSSCDDHGNLPELLIGDQGGLESSDDDDDSDEHQIPRRNQKRRRNKNRKGLRLADSSDSSNDESLPNLVHREQQAYLDKEDIEHEIFATVERIEDGVDSDTGGNESEPEDEVVMSEGEAGARVSTFVSSNYRCKVEMSKKRRKLELVKHLQALWRGHAARSIHHPDVVEKLKEGKIFRKRWGGLVSLINEGEILQPPNSWESLKRSEYNMARVLEDCESEDETFDLLDSAAAAAMTASYVDEVEPAEEYTPSESASVKPRAQIAEITNKTKISMDSIKLTQHVLKWLGRADEKFKGLFIRRIEQLAAGERSRILMKHLTGCKTTIYETYLEQKSGHRIIWTPCVDDGKPAILVWYVAAHKQVSRLIGLIDESEKRSARGPVSAESLYEREDSLILEANSILVDPQADTPLKVYQVRPDEMERLNAGSWVPPLRLTKNEQECVQKEGTVLLLGRSGTGKTICICNRMDFDHRSAGEDVVLKQLFVARSNRICEYVKGIVHETSDDRTGAHTASRDAKFLTFKKFIEECSKGLHVDENGDASMNWSKRVDFQRYKRDIYPELQQHRDSELDPLVIWTQIRSFIKGSLEAAIEGRALEQSEYLALGKNRCRLTDSQRQGAYAAFEAYNEHCQDKHFWDECDKVTNVLRSFKKADDHLRHEMQYDKIYIDEIQDYTQTELALFYLMCSQGGLFFAGDTAQSVEEGVTFRFEDLRSVAYKLYSGDRRYIPEKPLTVNVNFRSHTGVLNLAAAILERMFTVFPGSANKLKPDKGVYKGPRPGFFKNMRMPALQSLLNRNEGVVLLTHDEEVDVLKERLDNKKYFVLGIREAKGLEFPDIFITNFFSPLPQDQQKSWKAMLLKEDEAGLKPGFPELETQLKLLYTATTRCSKRLFFVETEESIAGKSFFRWLTTKELAGAQEAAKVEKVLTPDEWKSRGVDFCILAEVQETPDAALEWLERAKDDFGRVGDIALARRAEAHFSSLKLRLFYSEDPTGERLGEKQELEIVQNATLCAKEGLLPEVFKLVNLASARLGVYAEEKLRSELLMKLEDVVN